MNKQVKIFMCGDVMTGRGIDQILPNASNPIIYEPYVKDAREYVELAEKVNGKIPNSVDYSYVWGDALTEFNLRKPQIKIINLETAITKSEEYIKKGINYRMNPQNILAIQVAKIDICALSNNHLLDWEYYGLTETLDTLNKADIKYAGAGRDRKESQKPAIKEINKKCRVIVFSCGHHSSGITSYWAATENRPGIFLLKDLSDKTIENLKILIEDIKTQEDIVILSIHWGGNWGYEIPFNQIEFAHKLIDNAHVDIIHGHSSHHVKGIEVYKNRLILYGCGDFINDYEGISGYEEFRGDFGLMYFATVNPSNGQLIYLEMTPTQIKNFRINYAKSEDVLWLRDVLNHEGSQFNTSVNINDEDRLILNW